MKYLLCLIALFIFQTDCFSRQNNTDQDENSLLIKLRTELGRKSFYDEGKIQRIEKLEKLLSSTDDLNFRYEVYLKLYNEYKSFNFEKAFNYAFKLQEVGRLKRDPLKIAYGKIKLGFILLSSGMFKETFDSLKTVQVNLLPDDAKKEYYLISARTYYDLSDFTKDSYYSPVYNKAAGLYIDSALALYSPKSFEYLYYKGLKSLKNGDKASATINFEKLLDSNHYTLTDHQFAVTASTLSDIFIQNKERDKAIDLLIRAAIADVKSSTKEAAALGNLAKLLHQRGDVDDAYVFIKSAMDDATYYGARQRKIQMGAILPLIAGNRINNVEEQRRALFFYASLLTALTVVLIVFAVIIYKQLRKIKIADKIILQANHNLKETINKLDEANKIKEEYIGYYFNLISEYIEKLEKFKRSVNNKLITKKYDDIQILVDNINLKKERDELFVNYDKAFLKIFPNFVSSFNALFAPENQVVLIPAQLLNTDLRIFSLIRLGVNDTEKIAHILGYSVNTIYNYKARLKSKSLIQNDDFEDVIMTIKAV
jgi:tetratricopeptide (TPR) repeat protein